MKTRALSYMVAWAAAAMLLAVATTAEAQLPSMSQVFSKQRSETEDVIYFRNNDVLKGEVLNESISVSTPYGDCTVPFHRCAGISFEGSRANTEALVTVNYNRITGIIKDRVIKFRIGTSGAPLDLRKEKIRFILLKRTSRETGFVDPNQKTNLFVMTNGDLLTGLPDSPDLRIATDYGQVPVTFSEIKNVEMQGGDNVTAVIQKKNGDVMRGTLETEELSLKLDMGVTVKAIYKDKFSKMFVDDGNSQVAAQFGLAQPVSGESDGAGFVAEAGGQVVTNTIGMKLKLIPPGAFTMGSPSSEANRDEDEGPQHKVTLTKGFYMGVTEVTQGQWEAVMGTDVRQQRDKANKEWPLRGASPQHPMYYVSWEEAQEFCKKLSAKEGHQYRLPTEAEWEYACRAGTSTAYYWGGSWDNQFGWCKENSGETTHEGGGKKPNAWGLFDMSGNVWEWCMDSYEEHLYSSSARTDPIGPSGGDKRVLRGGSWYFTPEYCRSANRTHNPDRRSNGFGFRVVRTP